MSRVSKFASVAAIVLAAVSCGNSENRNTAGAVGKAHIAGKMAEASSEVVVGMLDMNKMVILDTLMTDGLGEFGYSVEVSKGDPEFVYIYSNGLKVASLILDEGDKVSVSMNADGKVDVSGSEESVKLMQVEQEHAQVSAAFAELAAGLEGASEKQAKMITAQMAQEYRRHNRNSVQYVMENSHSLTVIPVLYRTLGQLPVFSMSTDAVLFSSIADSLAVTYPDSRYVKSLKADADRRFSELEFEARLSDADVIGYLDVELPGLDGKVKKLSELDSKVVLLYFWTASQAQQNIFNIEVLKKLYKDYHHKGFDIYQVSLDTDRVMWATTVMGQELPWTNVNDMLGASSPYVSLYNLQVLPSAFVISDGELVNGEVVDEASFRQLLEKLLR